MPKRRFTKQRTQKRNLTHKSSTKSTRFANGVSSNRKDDIQRVEPVEGGQSPAYQIEDYIDGVGGGPSPPNQYGNRCECMINYNNPSATCISSNSQYECSQGCDDFCNMFSANASTGNSINDACGECNWGCYHEWSTNACNGTNNYGFYMCTSGYQCQQLNGWPQI